MPHKPKSASYVSNPDSILLVGTRIGQYHIFLCIGNTRRWKGYSSHQNAKTSDIQWPGVFLDRRSHTYMQDALGSVAELM